MDWNDILKGMVLTNKTPKYREQMKDMVGNIFFGIWIHIVSGSYTRGYIRERYAMDDARDMLRISEEDGFIDMLCENPDAIRLLEKYTREMDDDTETGTDSYEYLVEQLIKSHVLYKTGDESRYIRPETKLPDDLINKTARTIERPCLTEEERKKRAPETRKQCERFGTTILEVHTMLHAVAFRRELSRRMAESGLDFGSLPDEETVRFTMAAYQDWISGIGRKK